MQAAVLCVLLMVIAGPVQAAATSARDAGTVPDRITAMGSIAGTGGPSPGSGFLDDIKVLSPMPEEGAPSQSSSLDIAKELSSKSATGRDRTLVDTGVESLAWKPLVPVDKVTLVGKDDTSYTDEYAYMAAVPSSAFYDSGADALYSNPLLIYEPPGGPYPSGSEPLNDYPSIKYFMDDWKNYTGGIDSFEFVCMDSANRTRVLGNWSDANSQVKVHSGNDPRTIAEDLSFWNFENAPVAVVGVIEPEVPYTPHVTSGSQKGNISAGKTFDYVSFAGTVDVGINTGIFHNFTVKPGYVYIEAWMSWSGAGKDPDLQLYDWQLGEAGASEVWNPLSGAYEYIEGYAYHTGPWGFGITYMPTENTTGFHPMAVNPADYTLSTTIYPGTEWRIPDRVPFGATNLTVKVTGDDPAERLGLILRDEAGACFETAFANSHIQTLVVDRPGQGYYNFSVIKLTNYATEATYNVTWTWNYTDSLPRGLALTSASHGAVIGSSLGAPLFYAYPNAITPRTIETMRRLGVKDVVLLDLGNRSTPSMRNSLKAHFNIADHITDLPSSYAFELALTNSSDVVFTTLGDWNYWLVDKPAAGIEPFTTQIGPATFAAAHHGTAPVVVQMDNATSQAAAYYRQYWIGAYLSRQPAVVGNMVLEGTAVYDMLWRMGLDRPGNETILTVADQFDIGIGFDRSLVGVANPGRLMGSPTDTAAWVSRSAFYPAIIFANPATDPAGQLMINGSNSTRDMSGLHITPGGEKQFVSPIVQTWVCYLNRFNERGSRYWGTNYTTTDGITPFWDPSPLAIDNDVNAARGRPGQYYPDISGSENMGFYASKAGWDSVYSTVFDKTIENVNRGALMWAELMHGGNGGTGVVGFWGDGEAEDNPWRSYETQGSTAEPDTVRMNKVNGLDNTLSTSENDRDGVVIAILEQAHTSYKNGIDFDNNLKNVHSMGFIAGSCLVAASFLQMALIRHGCVYQIIDPWLTSWYVDYAMTLFVRYLAMNYSVGEAYSVAISQVGISYLTKKWSWDIYENVVFFGDPGLRIYAPAFAWSRPQAQHFEDGLVIGDKHSPFGAPHLNRIESLKFLDGNDDGTGNFTVAYARLKDYTFRVTVRDPDGLTDLNQVRLVSGLNALLFTVEANVSHASVKEVADPNDLVRLNTAGTPVSNDGLCVATVDFALKFNWTFGENDLKNVSITAIDPLARQVAERFDSVYRVRNELELFGNLTATAEFQGNLSDGDWVRGGEGITWSNLTVGYLGKPEILPPPGEFNITISGANGTWGMEPAPGQTLSLKTNVPASTTPGDIHRLAIGSVPKECDRSNLTFLVRVDATPPTIPQNITVHADSFTDTETTFDNDPQLFISWKSPADGESGLDHLFCMDGAGLQNDSILPSATTFGPCNASGDGVYKFNVGAVDRVGNVGLPSNGTIKIDRLPVEWELPEIEWLWRNSSTVIVNSTVRDEGLSGLKGSSIMYQLGTGNATDIQWGNWVQLDSIGDAAPNAKVNLSIRLNLTPDGAHFVRWSATDVAGNPRVNSSWQQFFIDTTGARISLQGPPDGVWHDGPKVTVNFSASDAHSGLQEIQYRVKRSDNASFGAWVPFDMKQSINPLRLNGTVSVALSEGPQNQILFRVRDVAGNDWTISESLTVRINTGHNASITSPLNGTNITKGQTVTLTAGDAGSIDGDVLTYTWFSSINGYLGNGTSLTILTKKGLDAGNHVITLYVDDGHGHNVSTSLTLNVLKPKVKPAEPGLNVMMVLIPLIVIIMVIGVVAFVVTRKKRGGPPPMAVPPSSGTPSAQQPPAAPTPSPETPNVPQPPSATQPPSAVQPPDVISPAPPMSPLTDEQAAAQQAPSYPDYSSQGQGPAPAQPPAQ